MNRDNAVRLVSVTFYSMVQGEASGEDEKDRFRLCSSCSRSLPRVITLRTVCTFDHVWYPMRLEQRHFIPCVPFHSEGSTACTAGSTPAPS
jgi:hypothetical protein